MQAAQRRAVQGLHGSSSSLPLTPRPHRSKVESVTQIAHVRSIIMKRMFITGHWLCATAGCGGAARELARQAGAGSAACRRLRAVVVHLTCLTGCGLDHVPPSPAAMLDPQRSAMDWLARPQTRAHLLPGYDVGYGIGPVSAIPLRWSEISGIDSAPAAASCTSTCAGLSRPV